MLRFLLTPSAVCGSALALFAQGRSDYVNFESPQVQPIAVATVDAVDYVFACNTPDNSVEVYRADQIESNHTTHGFVARIPVGPEPVSVLYRSSTKTLYAANWLGDSITMVTVQGGTSFTFQVQRIIDLSAHDLLPASVLGDRHQQNQQFGHQPLSLALFEAENALLVAKESASSIAWLDPVTGANRAIQFTVNNGQPTALGQSANVILTDLGPAPFGQDPTAAPFRSPLVRNVVKEPRVVGVRPSTAEIWVLGHQGGGSKAVQTNLVGGVTLAAYDLDVWVHDRSTGTTNVIGGLGTTNFHMAFHPAGTFVYVIGAEARTDIAGNTNLKALATGFVETWLYKINAATKTVVARRNLNTTGAGAAVLKTQAMAQATGIAFWAGISGLDHVVVTAFGSDRVAVIDVTSNTGSSWAVRRLNIPDNDNFAGGLTFDNEALAGPRAVAVRDIPTGQPTLDRGYVLNRLNNSITVVQLTGTGTPGSNPPAHRKTFRLKHDPVPAYVRDGQRFLYNAHFSEKGFVSCASCHTDGRSDQQQWRLSSDSFDAPDPFEVGETVAATPNSDVVLFESAYPTPKNGLITQSLQGLVNFEVDRNDIPTGVTRASPAGPLGTTGFDLMSNAPYHWRGDKPSFRDFNEAFFNLQGFPIPAGLTAPNSLTVAQMLAYEAFVRSIHYPPNPMQRRDRELSGSLGTPSNVSAGNGSGAQRGLKLFTQLRQEAFGGRSCIQCHFLPEGSNNRVTTVPTSSYLGETRQPLETAALRGMRQKEGLLELSPAVPVSVLPPFASLLLRSGDFGTTHEGFFLQGTVVRGLSLNHFMTAVGFAPADLTDITAFLREFDHSIAPIVGRGLSVLRAEINASGTITNLAKAAAVVEIEGEFGDGNCGVAALIDNGNGVRTTHWLRWTASNKQVYRNAATSGELERVDLLKTVATGGVCVFTATPLGGERRYATLTSGPAPAAPLTSGTFSAQLDVDTAPNDAYDTIPLMTGNWTGFWTGQLVGLGPAPFPRSLDTLQIFQRGLPALSGATNDAPRRLRIVGQGLVEGAVLEFGIPVAASPYVFETVQLPLFATAQVLAGGRVWETAVEFDPLALYILLAGGPNAPGVEDALRGKEAGRDAGALAFNPGVWNRYRVRVRNPDGQVTVAVEAPLQY